MKADTMVVGRKTKPKQKIVIFIALADDPRAVVHAAPKHALRRFSLEAATQLSSQYYWTKDPNSVKEVLVLPRIAQTPPTDKALHTVVRWMIEQDGDSRESANKELEPFMCDTKITSVSELVDVFAACVTFHLLPIPHVFIKKILDAMWANPVSAKDVEAIWTKLPRQNILLPYMIQSLNEFFRNWEIDENENDAIEAYYETEPELKALFIPKCNDSASAKSAGKNNRTASTTPVPTTPAATAPAPAVTPKLAENKPKNKNDSVKRTEAEKVKAGAVWVNKSTW